MRTILPFSRGRITTPKGPKDMYDLTFLVYCTISVVSQKSIIELRNTSAKQIHKTLLQGILKFSHLLNLKFVWVLPHHKSKVIYDLGHER